MKPTVFGRYTLIEHLGSGGMAEVFLAKTASKGLERLVAIKRIHSHLAADQKFTSMFIDEANLAAKLAHANIAQIFDLGKVDDQYFIAMEYVHGRDLRALFRYCQSVKHGMPLGQACYIGMKLCEGLDYAHNRKDYSGRELGLVHRDVSLNNIILSFDGELKIIDFGVAKAAIGRHTRTETGFVKGKIAYMSPEQLGRRPVDRRSDIFACGIILFELLTATRLYLVPSLHDLVRKVRNAEVPPLRDIDPTIPEELEKIVLRAMEKAADDRFQTAGDMHDALSRFVQHHGCFLSRSQISTWMIDLFREHYEAESARIAALWERSKQIELEHVPAPAGQDYNDHLLDEQPAHFVLEESQPGAGHGRSGAQSGSGGLALEQSLSGEAPTDVFQPPERTHRKESEPGATPGRSGRKERRSVPMTERRAASAPLAEAANAAEATAVDVMPEGSAEIPIEARLPLPSPEISVDQMLEAVPRMPRRARPFRPDGEAEEEAAVPAPARERRLWLGGVVVLVVLAAIVGILSLVMR